MDHLCKYLDILASPIPQMKNTKTGVMLHPKLLTGLTMSPLNRVHTIN